MILTRVILVFFLLVQFSLSSAQEYEVFEVDGQKGIKKGNAEEVLLPPSYEFIGWSDGSKSIKNGIIGYSKNGFWGLISAKGKLITNPIYRSLDPIAKDFILASTLGKFSNKILFGAINGKGKVITSFRYSSFKKIYDGYLILSEQANLKIKYGVLSPNKGMVLPIKYQRVETIGAKQLLVKSFTGFYGVINLLGEIIVPVRYDVVESIGFNKYLVFKDGLKGVINDQGKVIEQVLYKNISKGGVTDQYPSWSIRDGANELLTEDILADSMEILEEGKLLLYRNSRQIVFNYKTKFASQLEGYKGESVLEDAFIVKDEQGYKVIDVNGKEVLPNYYDSVYYDGNYYYAKQEDEKERWSLFSKIGTKLTDQVMKHVLPVSGKRIMFEREEHWGLLNFDGTLIAHPKYDTILPFRKRRALVKQLDFWGLVDDQNQWIILPYEESLQYINDDLYVSTRGYHIKFFDRHGKHFKSITTSYSLLGEYILIKGEFGKYGLLDYSGNSITSIAYDTITEISDSNLFSISIDGLNGVIDAQERVIVPVDSSLQKIVGIAEGKIGVKIDDKYGFLNTSGQLIISNRYDNIRLFSEGYAAYQLNDHWGFVDDRENLIIQPLYDDVFPFYKSVAAVKKNGLWGFINNDGDVLLDYQFSSIRKTMSNKYIVTKNDKQGLIDENGKFLLLSKYQYLEDIGDEKVIVKTNDLWGVLKYDGTYLIPTLYKAIDHNQNGKRFLLTK